MTLKEPIYINVRSIEHEESIDGVSDGEVRVTFLLHARKPDGVDYQQEWVEIVPASLEYMGEPSVINAALKQLQDNLSLFSSRAQQTHISM